MTVMVEFVEAMRPIVPSTLSLLSPHTMCKCPISEKKRSSLKRIQGE